MFAETNVSASVSVRVLRCNGRGKMKQTAGSVSAGNNVRNAYVVRQLTDALVELLAEKPLGAVTVSELCERAQVGRASFYRNFSSKEDVLRAHVRRLLTAWARGHETAGDDAPAALVRSLFSHLDANRDFYGLLAQRDLTYLLKDEIVERVELDVEGPAPLAYARAYVAYTLYGWAELWFARGMRDSPDEIAALLERAT